MKVAVINFSGNVGKTTVARHLLAPRITGAEVIAIESINADDGQAQALRGRQFGELQEYLQTVENVVVDIGASNVEELLALMLSIAMTSAPAMRGARRWRAIVVLPTLPEKLMTATFMSDPFSNKRVGFVALHPRDCHVFA